MQADHVRLADNQVKEGTACVASHLAKAPLTRGRLHPSPPRARFGREFYRRRFESSVLGQHSMMPDMNLSQHFKSGEEPAPFPSGPNTSFLDPTPMPARFEADSLTSHNYRHTKQGGAKTDDPTYSTSSSEVGKLPLQAADFPIRWYGLRGEFTSAFFLGGKGPASKVSTGPSPPPSPSPSPSPPPHPPHLHLPDPHPTLTVTRSTPDSTRPWTAPTSTTHSTRGGQAIWACATSSLTAPSWEP